MMKKVSAFQIRRAALLIVFTVAPTIAVACSDSAEQFGDTLTAPNAALSRSGRDTARDSVPRDSVPRDSIPRDSVPRDSVPRDSVPRDSVPRDSVPRDSVPRDSVPRDSVPRDSVPRDSVPRDSIPRDSIPRDSVPGDSVPATSFTLTARVLANLGRDTSGSDTTGGNSSNAVPVGGATVSVFRLAGQGNRSGGPGTLVTTVITPASGVVVVPNLPSGHYRVEVVATRNGRLFEDHTTFRSRGTSNVDVTLILKRRGPAR